MARMFDLDLVMGAAPAVLALSERPRVEGSRVWRRVRVPSDLTLADLHRVIQVVMRWDDVHLHVFDVGGREYGPEPDEEEVSLHWAGDDSSITVGIVAKKERVFEYTYDFGTERRVEITVVSEVPFDSLSLAQGRSGARPHIECIDGDGDAFDANDANTRLAEEFRGGRPVAGAAVSASPEDRLQADLTLLLLFLGSWAEGKTRRAANKTMRIETLDALGHAGLLITNPHRKSVDLTEKGVKRAEELLQRVTALLHT